MHFYSFAQFTIYFVRHAICAELQGSNEHTLTFVDSILTEVRRNGRDTKNQMNEAEYAEYNDETNRKQRTQNKT